MSKRRITTRAAFADAIRAVPFAAARVRRDARLFEPLSADSLWHLLIALVNEAIERSDWPALRSLPDLYDAVDRSGTRGEMYEASYVAFLEDLRLPSNFHRGHPAGPGPSLKAISTRAFTWAAPAHFVQSRNPFPIIAPSPIMFLDPADFDRACTMSEGFPRPDWAALWRWLEENVPAERQHAAVTHLERLWLTRLAAHLGGGYRVAESESFLVLYDPEAVDEPAFLGLAEQTLSLIDDALERATPSHGDAGKFVILVFTEDDDYYDYVSHFHADGHYGTFAGCCFREGDVHVALRCPEDWLRRTLAHELTHACLTHLPLPLWLEEGVVEVVTRRVANEDPPPFDALRRERHYAFWSFHGLTGFWNGSSFSRPDELQYLSYELAEAVVRLMNAQDDKAFEDFLLAASAHDSGESAAKHHLGKSTVSFVAQLLGEGPWLPPADHEQAS